MQRINLVKKLKTLSRVEHKLSPRSSSYPHLHIPKRAADIPRALHQNCSAEANRILPLSSTMPKDEPKHPKRCTYFHCFQTPWLQLHHPVPQPVLGDPLDTNARWEQPGPPGEHQFSGSLPPGESLHVLHLSSNSKKWLLSLPLPGFLCLHWFKKSNGKTAFMQIAFFQKFTETDIWTLL